MTTIFLCIFLKILYNQFGDFMTLDMETISLVQLDLDNEKSEYELKAIKLTMEGNKEESNYFSQIVNIYNEVSHMLDLVFNNDYDKFINDFNRMYLEKRNEYLTKLNDLDNPTDGFLAGYKLMYLDEVYQSTIKKVKQNA